MSIHKKEDELFEKWRNSYPVEIRDQLCFDGLCYNGELYNNDKTSGLGDEEELWSSSKRKVLFLTKDPNNNPGEDCREWPWSIAGSSFSRMIFSWLYGLSEINSEKYQPFNNYRKERPYPLAIVNIKKMSGGSSVECQSLIEAAKRDTFFLKQQVAEILQPNIVVCCGGSGCVLNIAKEYIYKDIVFQKKNNWCYYAEKEQLLLIDSWHPSSRKSNEEKYDDMMRAVQDFIKSTSSPIF